MKKEVRTLQLKATVGTGAVDEYFVYVKSSCRICKKSINALCDGESPQADFRYFFGTCQLRKVPFMYSKTSLRK
jgi:hypothetical protein